MRRVINGQELFCLGLIRQINSIRKSTFFGRSGKEYTWPYGIEYVPLLLARRAYCTKYLVLKQKHSTNMVHPSITWSK